MSKKLVSIIIPCFNAEKYLRDTIQSVLWQTYQNWECILVDDGSIDSSAEIFKQFQTTDNRFIYAYQINQGPSAARNYGVKISQGQYIQFLDADDILFPKRLEECLNYFNSHPNCEVVYSDYALFDETQHFVHALPAELPYSDALRSFLFELDRTFTVLMHSFLFKRQIIEENPFDLSLGSFGEDMECWVRIATKGIHFFYIDKILVIYRRQNNSLTSNETILWDKKINVLAKYNTPPYNINYKEEFSSTLIFYQYRLAIACAKIHHHTRSFQILRTIISKITFSNVLKIALWNFVMIFTTKRFIFLVRAFILNHSKIKWEGWKNYEQLKPPTEIIQLLKT